MNAIYIRITPVDEAYAGMHPDLIAQDIMPSYTTGIVWERVEAMPMDAVVKMVEEMIEDLKYSGNWEAIENLKPIAARYGIKLD